MSLADRGISITITDDFYFRDPKPDIVLVQKSIFEKPARPYGLHPPWTHRILWDKTKGSFFAEMMDSGFDVRYYAHRPDYFVILPGSGTVYLDTQALTYITLRSQNF